jgi:hypothetical protein
MSRLNWLHLSDLHVGMTAQGWLWPRFEKEFLDDLVRLHDKSGPWHLMLFTGDLVRAGSAGEFARLDGILDAIYARLALLGSQPGLVTLPGNHDLARPASLDARTVGIGQYSAREDLRADFWGEDAAGYRAFANSLFQGYADWRRSSIAAGRHVAPTKEGLLVGDASYLVRGADATARIVALNSTWLQIEEGDFRGRLVVDPRQLIAAVPGGPDEWLADCDLPMLATHQPTDWLTADAQADWRSEIYSADRFALHAFGHMHVAESRVWSMGGGGIRREFQACSLFGLEKTATGVERIQGYTANRFGPEARGAGIRVWPRVLTPVAGGELKLKADGRQDLEEDNSFLLRLGDRPSASPAAPPVRGPLIESRPVDVGDGSQRFRIENIEVPLTRDPAHAAVRRGDQQRALDAWGDEARAFWLVSDWGLGEEAFVASVGFALGVGEVRCFRLGLEGFRTRADFLESVRATHGITFEEICDRIEERGEAILVLADAPLLSPATPACRALASEIEDLVSATRDYLEHGRFVVTARTPPVPHALPVIGLAPFDEPDLRTYVGARRRANGSLTSAATVSRLHRLTDGHPGRLDAALRQLEVVSLNELVMSNSDVEPAEPVGDLPIALPAVVSGLRSEGEAGERGYGLLQSLSLFPGGEQLERVKRFDPVRPYFAGHATMLLDRHLIEATTYSQFGEGTDTNAARLLVVPRPVRDFVRGALSDQERERLDRMAVELFFGNAWKEGLSKGATAARIARNPLAPPHELFNCNTIVLRMLVSAREKGSEVDAQASVRLAVAYLERQIAGGHYRSALALSEDLAPAIKDAPETTRAVVEIARAKCLRMTGRTLEARDAYLAVDDEGLSKKMLQEIQLGLAMTYGQAEERRAAAERTIRLGAGSSSALQARALLAQMEPPSAAREQKLERLLNKARSTKAHVVENNIRLFRAEEASPGDRRTMIRGVLEAARANGDFYNRFRAIVRLLEVRDIADAVSEADRNLLISAYHFFHNERMEGLFNRTHKLLWRMFEADGDIWNLLSLFRHSSFIWRLAGTADSEREYLEDLRPLHDSIVRSNLPDLGRERTYFLVRLRSAAD